MQHETDLLSNEEKEKCIKDYVEIEFALARKTVKHTETVPKQEHKYMRNAENIRLTTREPDKPFQKMIVATGARLSNLSSSDDVEDGQYEDDDDTELGKLSEETKPSCKMSTISKMVQQCMEMIWQKHLNLDEWT